MLLFTALLAGCTDGSQIVDTAPGGPRASTSGNNLLTVRGFTTNATFQRYANAPSTYHTSTHTFFWNKPTGGLDSVIVKPMSAGVPESMNGGETYVSANVHGVDQAIGSASGDMLAQLQVFAIPAGGYATLYAHPNPDCRFLFFEDENRTRYYANPHVVSSFPSLDTTREAWFMCGTLGGGGSH
jgi:hypothetical protein